MPDSSPVIREFQDRVVLVTGGARGLGGGIAEAFSNAGATVVIADILTSEGEALAKRLGGGASFKRLDVTSADDWDRVVEEIAGEQGRLDVLVNGAGILVPGGIEDTEFAQFKRVMDISCDGTFLGMQRSLPLLKTRADDEPYAAVVNISSIGAFNGAPGALSYGASRAALLSMTKSAALDFAKRGYRIRVNSVHPGSVKTDLSEITYERLMSAGMTRDQAVQYMTNLHPMGRLGTIDDIAQAVMYLASERASWVTGTSLTVDGGRTA